MLHTDRLSIEQFTYADCGFVLELMNEPSFRRFIGDKGIRTPEDARKYLRDAPLEHYDRHGFGLYRVSLRASGIPVGMNGLVRRAEFEHPDLGFAFLKAHWSKGYAHESSLAVIGHARTTLGIGTIFAMADEDNAASVRLLDKLGFRYRGRVTMPGEATEVLQFELTD